MCVSKLMPIIIFILYILQPFLPDLQSGRIHPKQLKPGRVTVYITIPVYTLKECAIQVVSKHLKCAQDALCLEIPRILQNELESYISKNVKKL